MVAHVTGRRADETGDSVLLLVLAHVEPQEAHSEGLGKLTSQLRLSHAGWTYEQERGNGFVPLPKARAGLADCAYNEVNGVVLSEDLCLEADVEVLEAHPLAA